jgi:hypothetical protein
MTPAHFRFIRHEITTLSIQGAFQRASIYAPRTSASERKALCQRLAEKLHSFAPEYANRVDEEQHERNIGRISEELSAEFKNSLHDGTFRIGIAQKALNLYLKYLWCLDRAARPPHCPFDSKVINDLPLTPQEKKDLKWTELESLEDYQTLVGAAKKAVERDGSLSLSDWELEKWSGQ